MSYKPEVKVQGDWCSNSLRFASVQEAVDYALNLFCRWLMCTDSRCSEPCSDPVTHTYTKGVLERV